MMRRTRLAAALALFALLALAARPARAAEEAAPSPAEQALRKAAEHYGALETFQGQFVLTQVIVTDEETDTTRMSIAVAVKKPDRGYVRVGPEGGELILVSDGEHLWTYSPSTGKYMEGEAPGDLGALFARPPLSQIVHGELKRVTLGLLTSQPYEALTAGTESLEHKGLEDGAARVALKGDGSTTEVWIDTRDGSIQRAAFHPWRILEVLKERDPTLQEVRIELALEPIEGGQGLEELLAFRPPEDAIEAEHFQGMMTVELVGRPMIDFTLEGLKEGTTWTLSEQKGKVIALDFFATWCDPCRAEMPAVARIYEDLKDEGFLLLAVDVAETRDEVAAFMDEMGLDLPVALDQKGEVAAGYAVQGIPKLVIIDRAGGIAAVHEGYRPGIEHEIRRQVEALLAEKPLQAG